MPDQMTGSTVPRRQLGRYLRDLRQKQRLTVRAAAGLLEWSEAKIWRIETGQVSLRSLDAEAMCRIYGASAELTAALMGLARETKARGWWHSYGDVIPEGFDVYIGLEEAASAFAWYESELIPGLLQTESYARTLIEAGNPGVDREEISRRVRLRLARQALLTRTAAPPQLRVVLNEAVIRRPVGGPDVMSGQLARLAEASALPSLSLRVMPFSAGLHAGIFSGPFVLLRFPLNGDGRETEPPVIYADGFTGALYLDKPGEIDRYDRAFTDMWATAADEAATHDLIGQAARELA
jgi:transcriptional regulator with XRE-family HTH domain